MFTKILNEDEIKKFVELTSLKASKVFLSKTKNIIMLLFLIKILK